MEFKEQKPRIVAVLHSVFATPKYAVSTSFSDQLFLYYALARAEFDKQAVSIHALGPFFCGQDLKTCGPPTSEHGLDEFFR